jgi:hypothetical protein
MGRWSSSGRETEKFVDSTGSDTVSLQLAETRPSSSGSMGHNVILVPARVGLAREQYTVERLV